MSHEFSTRVDTALGGWRIVASDRGLVRILLEGPEGSPDAPPPPQDPPPWFTEAAARVRSHLKGAAVTYDELPLARNPGGFQGRVQDVLRRLPWGVTMSYGALAAQAGSPGGARAVGNAMARNPLPLVVPCHRVLPRGGGLGGFSATGGAMTKFLLLSLEGTYESCPDIESMPTLGVPLLPDAAHGWLERREPRLAPYMARSGVWRPRPAFPAHPFAALAQAVVYQQLAGAAAAAIFRRLQGQFGAGDRDFPEATELAKVPRSRLLDAGLSAAKADTISALARRIAPGGDLDPGFLEQGPWSTVEEGLLSTRGVGPWTVAMFGLFHRHHPDLLPSGDLGLRRAAGRIFGDGGEMRPDRLERLGRRWRPFRSVAAWHLWSSEGTVTM